MTGTSNLLIHSQTHCPLFHRTSDINCGRSVYHTSLSDSLPRKTLSIPEGLEPAIFWFVVRRVVRCATGPLTYLVAGQLVPLACLNPIAPPPPPHEHASMDTNTIVGGGGGGLPTTPHPLNTSSQNTAAKRPPHYSYTQQHTTKSQLFWAQMAQKSLDFQGPPLTMPLVMMLHPSKPLHTAP